MREVELCPSCYGQTVKQPNDWFCIPCVSTGGVTPVTVIPPLSPSVESTS